MKQPEFILPNGTRVLTHPTLKDPGFMPGTQFRRPGAAGTIRGVVGGFGGDVYWVEHQGVGVAAYCFTDFEVAPGKGDRSAPDPAPPRTRYDRDPFE